MVDKDALKAIGWVFGSTTAAVMVIATLLVAQTTSPSLRAAPSEFSSTSR